MKNKKASQKLFSLYWYFLWIVSIVGIVACVSVFSSSPIDTRSLEARILADRLLVCASKDPSLLAEFSTENLKKSCGLVIPPEESSEYLISIFQYSPSSCTEGRCSNPLKEASLGNNALAPLCGAKGSAPECYEENIYSSPGSMIKVKIAVLKLSQNVI